MQARRKSHWAIFTESELRENGEPDYWPGRAARPRCIRRGEGVRPGSGRKRCSSEGENKFGGYPRLMIVIHLEKTPN